MKAEEEAVERNPPELIRRWKFPLAFVVPQDYIGGGELGTIYQIWIAPRSSRRAGSNREVIEVPVLLSFLKKLTWSPATQSVKRNSPVLMEQSAKAFAVFRE
jgi:hypothetical protein